MKEVTEKQLGAIDRLSRATGTIVDNPEKLTRVAASEVITGLIERLKEKRGRGASAPSSSRRDYSTDALAGMAVKIVAQKCSVEDVLKSEESFKEKVAELFKVFLSARQGCLV